MRRTVLTVGAYTFVTLLSLPIVFSTDWRKDPWYQYQRGHTFHVIAGIALPLLLFAFVAVGIQFRTELSAYLRRPRTLCRRCGYDLRAHDAGAPCPECGQSRGASA